VGILMSMFNTLKMGLNMILLYRYDRWTIASYFRKQGAQIGRNCSIMVRSLGTEPYLVKLGNNVGISHGVVFATHEGAARIGKEDKVDLHVFGPIVIEDNCFIGQNVFLSPNIRIGRNSIIGANSVVISDIPPDRIAMGVPARVIGSTEKFKEKCRDLWKKQEPPGFIVEEGKDFFHSKYYKENRKKLKEHLINLYWKEPGDKNQNIENIDTSTKN
jgi:acetyltransferase-like isoleucine patch superfamily enzyme